VITLAADRGLGSDDTTSSFATPNVVHFTIVLLMSGVLSAPWHGVRLPLLLMALIGVGGCIYVATVIRTARRQSTYQVVLEDVIWHWCLPAAAYVGLLVCVFFSGHGEGALFSVAAAAMLLMAAGIHNAWDSAVYIAAARRRANSVRDTLPPLEDSGD
jgi:hypothetical protein